MRMFEWIDPWETIDRFEYEWRTQEDRHREEMQGMALAFADASHTLRRQAEAMLDPLVRAAALQPVTPFIFKP